MSLDGGIHKIEDLSEERLVLSLERIINGFVSRDMSDPRFDLDTDIRQFTKYEDAGG
jgi:hypothetical protein